MDSISRNLLPVNPYAGGLYDPCILQSRKSSPHTGLLLCRRRYDQIAQIQYRFRCQGAGELDRLAIHTEKFGKRAFAVIDEFFYKSFTKRLDTLYKDAGGAFLSFLYQTEITKELIEKASDEASGFSPDVIIGIGGGKALDTAKAVASRLSLPLVIIPTSASTDAPTSAMSIIYNDAHEHDDVYYYIKNPDLVLVDSQIIADAPVRFLVSGMGDALATVFEGRTSIRTNQPNYICGESGSYMRTRTAAAIAEECYRTICEFGVRAKIANELHVVTDALDAVIEANTLMSGLGFENVGCAASHVVCNGITAVPGGDKALHGEKVAFGVICQLLAENEDMKLIEEVIRFNLSVGLPVTLDDMGIAPTEENFDIISANPQETEWTREPFYMDAAKVKAVVKTAHELGKRYKKGL